MKFDSKKCTFFVDDQRVFVFKKVDGATSKWPFDKKFHLQNLHYLQNVTQ